MNGGWERGPRSLRARPAPLLILLLAPLLAGAVAPPNPAPVSPRARNLILISIDTLRADRLGAYGYARPTSPEINALARRGAVFERAIAQASWTLPSHMTIFSGLFPTTHGVVSYERKLPESVRTLAGVLRERGFRTDAIVEGGYLNERFGYDQGFDSYIVQPEGIRGLVERAKRTLDERPAGGRAFLLLHTYGVHCPYSPAMPYRMRFVRSRQDQTYSPRLCGRRDFEKVDLTERQIRDLSDLYDGSIRETDDSLGELFRFLEARKGLEETLVVILSDHGEAFHEHGVVGHMGELYYEVLHVPLILAGPGVPAGRVDPPVGLVDVMPTVLDLLGIEGVKSQGRSLVPLMRGEETPFASRAIFSAHGEGPDVRSVVKEGLHLIVSAPAEGGDGAPGIQLFDIDADPGETVDLARVKREAAKRLLELLDAHTARAEQAGLEFADAPTKEELERLRSLGYVD